MSEYAVLGPVLGAVFVLLTFYIMLARDTDPGWHMYDPLGVDDCPTCKGPCREIDPGQALLQDYE